MLLHGIFPPLTTPFYAEGNLYFKKLQANVERYCRAPIAGLLVLGSTGEAILLSDQEQRDVLRAAREAATPEKVLIAGTGVESASGTLRLTEYAADLGYDVALVRTPYYYKGYGGRAENILAFYRTVADRSPLPVLIYNLPASTGYDIPPELVIELAAHPNIIGIKDSGGSVEKVRRMVEGTRHIRRSVSVTEVQEAVTGRMLSQAAGTAPGAGGDLLPVGVLAGKPSSAAVEVVGGLKTRIKEVGFQVVVGAPHQLLASLDAGAVGGILGFACAAPTACFEVYLAWKEHAAAIAAEKQQRISEAAYRITVDLGPWTSTATMAARCACRCCR
jgi:dihydrodipicolinate synthase/N-acetylneuraminate lyase